MRPPVKAPRSGHFCSRNLRLHYIERGDPAAPLIVMLHGGLEHVRFWDPFAEHFASTHRVVCMDLRGHGDSEWSTGGAYSVLDGVYDLHCLLRHLEAPSALLVGHSFGANIAIRFAGLFPDRVGKLVGIEGLALAEGTPPREAGGIPALLRLRRWMVEQDAIEARAPRRYPSIDAAAQRLRDSDPLLLPDVAERAARHGLHRNEDGSYSWKYDPRLYGGSPTDLSLNELRSLWSAITCPTLLVHGLDSWASSPQRDGRIAFFRQVSVLEVPGAGHNVHHQQPDVVLRAMDAFFR